MQEIIISNKYVQATISTLAAEVVSFKSKDDNLERVWGRDPKGWRNCNPILFPITGPLDNGKYSHNGKEYSFGQHGFARDSEFVIESQKEDSATLSLTYNDTILEKHYPFKFKLTVNYKLDNYRLLLSYQVENLDECEMPFVIGFHPAFNCPLQETQNISDYSIVFPHEENLNSTDEKLSNGKQFNVTSIDDVVNFFFYNHSIKSNYVDLTDSIHTLRVGIEGYATLGFWHKNPECRYVCIEPWLPDNNLLTNNFFKEKEMNWLLPAKEKFNCSYYWEIIK